MRSGASQKGACQTVEPQYILMTVPSQLDHKDIHPAVVFVHHSSFRRAVYIHFPSHSAAFVAWSSLSSLSPTTNRFHSFPFSPFLFVLAGCVYTISSSVSRLSGKKSSSRRPPYDPSCIYSSWNPVRKITTAISI